MYWHWRDWTDRWHWSIDVDGGVGFCIWVLGVDGLRVPPFEHHPEGDGTLRLAGLTGAAWQAWLYRVLELNLRLKETIATGARPLRDLALPAHLAHTAWIGDPGIGARLAELWPQYQAQADTWKRDHTGPAAPWHASPREHRELWRQLRPFRRQLPPMHIYLVEYPQVVLSIVPPATALLGTGNGALDWTAYADSVLRAAEALAQHGRPRGPLHATTQGGAA